MFVYGTQVESLAQWSRQVLPVYSRYSWSLWTHAEWSREVYSRRIGGARYTVRFLWRLFFAIMRILTQCGASTRHISTLLSVKFFKITDQFRSWLKNCDDVVMLSLKTQERWPSMATLVTYPKSLRLFHMGVPEVQSITWQTTNHSIVEKTIQTEIAAVPGVMIDSATFGKNALHFEGRH